MYFITIFLLILFLSSSMLFSSYPFYLSSSPSSSSPQPPLLFFLLLWQLLELPENWQMVMRNSETSDRSLASDSIGNGRCSVQLSIPSHCPQSCTWMFFPQTSTELEFSPLCGSSLKTYPPFQCKPHERYGLSAWTMCTLHTHILGRA